MEQMCSLTEYAGLTAFSPLCLPDGAVTGGDPDNRRCRQPPVSGFRRRV